MKISAILLSRVLAFIDTVDLRPSDGLYAPDFVEELAAQFRFQKFPKTLEDFDIQKGIVFDTGQVGKKAVGKLVIWPNILVIESRSNTTECKQMLEEILQWGVDKFKLAYSPQMIKRYAYVSDISFYSGATLLNVSPALSFLANSCTTALSEIWNEPIDYRPLSLKVGHDPVSRQVGIASFSIERLGTSRFSENKYFSEAPLPTDVHVRLLEQFEEYVVGSGRAIV